VLAFQIGSREPEGAPTLITALDLTANKLNAAFDPCNRVGARSM
jgi:hypothetical protein